MQKLILRSLWMVCFPLSIFSQNKTIQGKVTHQETQLLILKAHISANGKSKVNINGISGFSIAIERLFIKLTYVVKVIFIYLSYTN